MSAFQPITSNYRKPEKSQLVPSGKSVIYGVPDLVGRTLNVQSIFGTRRDIQAQRRFQKELREADRRLSLFAFDQCRTFPVLFLGQRFVCCRCNRCDLVGEARLFLVARRMSERTTRERCAGDPALTRPKIVRCRIDKMHRGCQIDATPQRRDRTCEAHDLSIEPDVLLVLNSSPAPWILMRLT